MEIRVLGPLEVWVDGVRVSLGGPRQEVTLAMLLLEPDRMVTVDRIAEALWDHDPPVTARRQVQNAVSALRRRFDEAGAVEVITREGTGYMIHVGDSLDALQFNAQVTHALQDGAAGRISDAVHGLRAALAQWRGQALAGIVARSVEMGAARLNESRLEALETCLEYELALGRHVEITTELMALVGENPFRERLTAQLMLALHRSGRQADALVAFQTLRTRLADEFGADPGVDVREMHEGILREDPAMRSPVESASLRLSIGHGSRILVPAQLPADIPDFTGRAAELAHLAELMPAADPGQNASVFVTAIVGMAGVGKTALAVHWAHRVAERFPDGQLYVDMNGYGPGRPMAPARALAQIMRALGVEPERIPITADESARMYRSLLAMRRILIVLDNAVDSEQVRPLLPGGPTCAVLITSRDRMAGLIAREGARRLTVDILDTADAQLLLTKVIGPDRAVGQHKGLVELADRCANLPLALRIAAANVTHDPYIRIGDYAAALADTDRLGELRADNDKAAAVRTAFDFSYHRLNPAGRRLFRLLGLAPGPDITASAAAALIGASRRQAEVQLECLTAAHLVQLVQAGRYRFHDLLRVYARDRALAEESADERGLATRRLLTWYVIGADAAARLLYPQMLRLPVPPAEFDICGPDLDGHSAALDWLDAERPNLTAATAHAAGYAPAIASQLSDALRGYFALRRHAIDWLAVAQDGLRASRASADRLAEALAHLSLGQLHWTQGRYNEAIESYTASLTAAREAESAHAQAAALANLGIVHWETGELSEAVDHYNEALRLNQLAGRKPGEANNHTNLGGLFREMGSLERSLYHCQRAADMHRVAGACGGEANALNNLGLAYYDLDRVDEALRALTQALTLYRQIGDNYGQATVLDSLARVHRRTNRHSQALGQAHAAMFLAQETGDRRTEANALNTLGVLHLYLGDRRRAVELHRKALSLARESGNRYQEAQSLIELAAACMPENVAEARQHAGEGLALSQRAGFGLLQRQAHSALHTQAAWTEQQPRAGGRLAPSPMTGGGRHMRRVSVDSGESGDVDVAPAKL